jgi:hypothetical protein
MGACQCLERSASKSDAKKKNHKKKKKIVIANWWCQSEHGEHREHHSNELFRKNGAVCFVGDSHVPHFELGQCHSAVQISTSWYRV